MKLKFYLRGLGIGIVVTALIMGIATKDGRPLTEAEIKAAAAKLGMVESNSLKLTDLQQGETPTTPNPAPAPEGQEGSEPEGAEPRESTPTSAPEPESTSTPTLAPESTTTPTPTSAPAPESTSTTTPTPTPTTATTPTPTPTPKPTTAPTPTPTPTSASALTPSPEESPGAETVKITIKSGTGSRSVCEQLADAGLIEDAAAFDRYLCDNSYARRICAGTYEIQVGASEEEIAKIITRSAAAQAP